MGGRAPHSSAKIKPSTNEVTAKESYIYEGNKYLG